MPNSFLAPSKNKLHGAIVLGDAMNMRHPLTGGGMTVALWDVYHMTNLLALEDLNNTSRVKSKLSQLHWKRKSRSSVINILAHGLYSLFSAGDGKAPITII